jgi:anti-sigma factor RsiW
MPHPDEGLIHAWLDGELDAAEAARVEALVTSDPEWAAAAAEARGLLAASARIVGALDHVPANVIPQRARGRHTARRWVWSAAAAVALMAGSAVVLQRGTPELTSPQPVKALGRQADSAAARAGRSTTEPAPASNLPASGIKNTFLKKELDKSKQHDTAHPKVAASALGGARADAAVAAGAARPVANAAAPVAAPPPAEVVPAAAPPPAARAMQAQAAEKVTRLLPSCFLQPSSRDSAPRMIRLDAVALADSIRLDRLTLRGDTLFAVHGSLTAIRVPCPEP